MSKKKKIVVISVAVTLALVLGVGGLASAFDHEHTEMGGHKLIGVGEMGEGAHDMNWRQEQEWDTEFIITNPNCERELEIEWVALVAGQTSPDWDAEEVIFEGTPADWNELGWLEIPGELSPHEVWQVSVADFIGTYENKPPYEIISAYSLNKYTLEVTWNGAYYSWWWGWSKVRPLTGWQKEKCWSYFDESRWGVDYPSFAISEAEMQLFPSKMPFRLPELPPHRG